MKFTYLKEKYQIINDFSNGLAMAKRMDGRIGFLDEEGAPAIPFDFYDDNRTLALSPCFVEGLCAVVNAEGKIGYINPGGQTVIPFIYDLAYPFLNGYAVVRKEGKYGIIDKKGGVLVPFLYDFLFGPAGLDDPIYAVLNGKAGYIDRKGQTVVDFEYDHTSDGFIGFFNGVTFLNKESTLLLVDRTGTVLYSFLKGCQPYPFCFEGGYLALAVEDRVKRRLCFLTPDMKMDDRSLPMDRMLFFDEEVFVLRYRNETKILHKSGKLVGKGGYERIGFAEGDGLRTFKKDGLYGYFDTDWQVAIPPAYIGAGPFSSGYAFVKTRDKVGVIDRAGEWIFPPCFEYPSSFKEGIAVVCAEGGYGLLKLK